MNQSNPYTQWTEEERCVANPLVRDGSVPSIDTDSSESTVVPRLPRAPGRMFTHFL